jgi:hypothetical protein
MLKIFLSSCPKNNSASDMMSSSKLKFLRSSAFSSLTLILVSIFFTQSCSAQSHSETKNNGESSLMPPSVPDYLVFAGDTIRFDRSDIRERMDREIIAFTYTHSTSILMIKRANRYFPQVEPILKANGIPDDLKYLMVIESNLDPRSVSSASAAGLWQFTESTGKSYGLVINENVDERYNIEKSTVAACKYLSEAYSKYGDWMTAAASYNGGQQGMSRKLESQNQKKAMDLWLVDETSRYMFRILVAKMMFSNPTEFGFYLTADQLYPNIPTKDTVVVTTTIPDLVKFAENHAVSYAQLKQANLWLRASVLNNSSHREYKIIIPDEKAELYDPKKIVPHNQAWVVK